MFSLALSLALDNAMGNGTLQSAIYVLWDSIFAVGISLGVITLFHQFFNKQRALGKFLAQQSYAVYIVHIPTVVLLTYAMRGVQLSSLPKFVLASFVIVPVCYVIAWIVRKIPFVSKVI